MKTAPNPLTVAAVDDPGTKNDTSVMLLPSAVNSRCALKAANWPGSVGSRLPNSIGVAVGLTAFALT